MTDPRSSGPIAGASHPDYRVVVRCRICGSSELWPFLDLGETPLANAFVAPDHADRPERRYPLAVQRCESCGLVQLTIVVRGEILFRDYVYSSSASEPMVEHFRDYAGELVPTFVPSGSLVVEIGSNDGILLAPLAARGAKILGVEPARTMAKVANAQGLETWMEFFGSSVAARIREEKGPAMAVVANNVLAHIDDLRDVMRGLRLLLGTSGVFVAEFPYLLDLLESVEYDTIYHEHLAYLALAPLRTLLGYEDLELFRVRRLPIHGGSLRVFAGRRGAHIVDPAVAGMYAAEVRAGLDDHRTYEHFALRVGESRAALSSLLGELRDRGASLAAYGATAKGNTLLNYCGIGHETLDFVADTTAFKQGLLTPGTHIPVLPEAALLERRPDYTLLLAWNYADAIFRRQSAYTSGGGRFIHPIPRARIVQP